MRIHCQVAGILCLLISLGAAPTPPRFLLNGKPIHPLSVGALAGDLAREEPVVAAVDLEGSLQSKSHRSPVVVEGAFVRADDDENGFVLYHHLGVTPGGLHVLVVGINGGGTGVFQDLIWVRILEDQVSENGKTRKRTMLLRVGHFTLGDRDDGQLRLEGGTLWIGKSRYRPTDQVVELQ